MIYNRDNKSNAYYYGDPERGVIHSVCLNRGIIGEKLYLRENHLLALEGERKKLLKDQTGDSHPRTLQWSDTRLSIKSTRWKRKADRSDYLEIKNFCSSKAAIHRMKMQATEWKEMSVIYASDRERLCKTYK